MSVLLETDLPNPYHQGKVRDTYEIDDEQFLLIATDRVSAFDVVLPNGIPDKGIVLNQLSAFWFDRTSHIVPNHVIEVVNDVNRLNSMYGERISSSHYSYPSYIALRSMIVRRAQRIDIECVVRGYISGSAWSEYQKTGSICKRPRSNSCSWTGEDRQSPSKALSCSHPGARSRLPTNARGPLSRSRPASGTRAR